MRTIAFDCETFRIGPGCIAPKMVCATFAMRDPETGIQTMLIGNHPDDELEKALSDLLSDTETRIVTHNGGYDYTVAMASYPKLIPLIFDALQAGRCTDTLWREKLLNLSSTGDLEGGYLPDGSYKNLGYSLADFEKTYIGRDRSAQKEDMEESWRVNFSMLDGWRAEDYPEEAAKYALEDAEGTLLVYEGQEARKNEWPMMSTQTEEFQLASSFALQLMTCWGATVNPEAVEIMAAEVEKRLAVTEDLLYEHKIITRAFSGAPRKGMATQRALKAMGLVGSPPADWGPYRERLEALGIPVTMAKPSKVNTHVLLKLASEMFQRIGVIPEMTTGGDTREPQIKMDSEVQDLLALHDPVMAKYRDRQALSKLANQQIPLLRSAKVLYPRYDALKETGRTSSYGNAKGKPGLYPALHIQGVPNEIEGLDPRQCYIPRHGTTFFDVDYTALELACVGQMTFELFQASVHLQRYNEGVDLHGYLGAQLVVMGATDGMGKDFTSACRDEGILSDPVAIYKAFMECKKHEDAEVRAFFKEWRTFAKPVGLGFPGGLGPETFVSFARTSYDVIITEEQAYQFREMWRAVYPEMPLYFDWVNSQTDEYNDAHKGETRYWYTTPLGMIRRGASFCSVANGKAMQSPGAEGAKMALIQLQRACYDPTQGSVLFGCRPIGFIHDQIIGETTEDSSLWHDQCMEVRRIMCEAMQTVLPNIKMRSDEAHLTSVWSKKSVPTFGPDGRLIPWTPSKTGESA